MILESLSVNCDYDMKAGQWIFTMDSPCSTIQWQRKVDHRLVGWNDVVTAVSLYLNVHLETEEVSHVIKEISEFNNGAYLNKRCTILLNRVSDTHTVLMAGTGSFQRSVMIHKRYDVVHSGAISKSKSKKPEGPSGINLLDLIPF